MQRIAGILMPVSSLPSPYGIGTLGRAAYKFVDFLKESGCGLWQVLPLQPTSFGDSPYSSFSAVALNHYFIDLDMLREEGLLESGDYDYVDWGSDERRVDYGKIYLNRVAVLKKAFARFDKSGADWLAFLKEGKFRDYALFMTAKGKFGGAACEEWGDFAEYSDKIAAQIEAERPDDVLFWQFTQFEFLRQWSALKEYAHSKNIKIVGDAPFYVARDSVETWKYKKDIFLLDAQGRPSLQAGVPPDAFSESGQLWGNPVYDWEGMRADGYRWWHNRIDEGLKLYDVLRIDHFIGFVRYYCIPAGEKDARNGEWRKGPGGELFKGYRSRGIIAEDLGLLTDEVRAEIKRIGFPGMKILQHAFDGSPDNEHLPSNYTENFVAYTGTHDNLTLMTKIGEMTDEEYEVMLKVLKRECGALGIKAEPANRREACEKVLDLLYASKADTVIFPLQDALCMGEEARINAPSEVSPRNWSFRFKEEDFSALLARRLYGLAKSSGRI